MVIILPPEQLSTFAHPWLVIEDAAPVEVTGLLEYFHKNGFQKDDYLIIEDTNKLLWTHWDDWEDKAEIEAGAKKMDNLRTWVTKYQEEYLVDTYYLDMYGYNGSKNWNSILKKV